MSLTTELDLAKHLAIESGKIALSLRSQLKISHKPNEHGPVTNADIAIDQLICNEIQKRFPRDSIISEESYQDGDLNALGERVWFIDPIDGTASYILGRDDFSVMIGLAIAGKAVLGVIYQPSTNYLWAATCKNPNEITFLKNQIEQNLCSKKTNIPESEIILVGSRSTKSKKQIQLQKLIGTDHLVRMSSVGLKAMQIVQGKANLYVAWSKKIKLWDTCASKAILSAAGFNFFSADKKPLRYDQGSIAHNASLVASNLELSDSLWENIEQISNS